MLIAFAATGSAIILLASFLVQNKVIESQIGQHNIYLRKERESHSEGLGKVLREIIFKIHKF